MNFNVILRSLGILLMLLGASMCGCLLIGETIPREKTVMSVNYQGWLTSIAVTIGTGALGYFVGRRGILHNEKRGTDADPNGFRVLRREAIAIVGLGWLVCSAFAALPYLLCLSDVGYDKAFFESCSGLTTTGSTIFPTVEDLPKTVLCWRSLTQWLGGMGILGAFLLIFSGETKGKTLLSFESSIHGSDLSSTNVRNAMRNLWRIYIILTAVCMLGLWMMDMTFFQAFNHSLTTTSTGGFGTENDSLTSFSPQVKSWVTFFMLGCGISFPLYMGLWKRRSIAVLKRHEETRWYLIFIAVAVSAIMVDKCLGLCDVSFLDALFNVVSIITTTGFAVGDYGTWSVFSQQVILLLMIIGGCSGSTAGGLKVSRIVLWMRSLKNEVIRGFRPNIVLRLKMNGNPVSDDVGRSVFVVISFAVFFLITGSLAVRILEPEISTLACVSSVLTCLSNVGPAFDQLGPTENFSQLSSGTLSFLSVLMVLGRLEYIAVLVLFSRRLWKKY